MNKYQEVLDKIKSYTNIIIDKGENYTLVKNQVPKECFDTLQELIEKYKCFELYFSENHKKQFNDFYERWKNGDE